jgi:hypothetical protein
MNVRKSDFFQFFFTLFKKEKILTEKVEEEFTEKIEEEANQYGVVIYSDYSSFGRRWPYLYGSGWWHGYIQWPPSAWYSDASSGGGHWLALVSRLDHDWKMCHLSQTSQRYT